MGMTGPLDMLEAVNAKSETQCTKKYLLLQKEDIQWCNMLAKFEFEFANDDKISYLIGVFLQKVMAGAEG
jgi:hypothetical protein